MTTATDLYHLDGVVPAPDGYTTPFCEMNRVSQDIHFQIFYTPAKKEKPRYRVCIRRNAYDHQSYVQVEMFMLGRGWEPVLRTGIELFPEIMEISYVALSDKTTPERRNEIFTVLSNCSCRILLSVLSILA